MHIKLYWMTSLTVVLAEENSVTRRVAAAHLLFKLSVLKDRQDGINAYFYCTLHMIFKLFL